MYMHIHTNTSKCWVRKLISKFWLKLVLENNILLNCLNSAWEFLCGILVSCGKGGKKKLSLLVGKLQLFWLGVFLLILVVQKKILNSIEIVMNIKSYHERDRSNIITLPWISLAFLPLQKHIIVYLFCRNDVICDVLKILLREENSINKK